VEPLETVQALKPKEAERRMQEIMRVMERTTLYTLLPGKEAIIGGVLALIGCALSYAMLRSFDLGALQLAEGHIQAAFYILWALVGTGAIAQDVLLTAHTAARQGISPSARPGRFAALSLTPSVIVAIVLTVKLVLDVEKGVANGQPLRYVAPIWMMCYGAGVYAAGLFSVRLPRLLGLAFIFLGVLGLLVFETYGLILVALSFGLMHVLFGIVVLRRSSRSRQA
jgi:hypothetical protein